MAVQFDAQAQPSHASDSRLYEEGMISGLIGAVALALWFFIVDLAQGAPLSTPSILGSLFFGPPGAATAANAPVSLEMVMLFTWIHALVFALIGVAAAWLLRLAERDPNYGFGIILLFVVFEFGFIGFSMLFAEAALQALTLTGILIGNLIAAAAMGLFFHHRHPDLTFLP